MSFEGVVVRSDGVLTIKPARPSDLDALVEIDTATNEWTAAIGYPAGEPPRPIRDILAERVDRGQVYLARLDGRPAGMVVLQSEDELWPETTSDAVYVHGLATHRGFAGKRIGLALLTFAEDYALRTDKRYVRLDCNADNPALRAYYERAGFAHRGDVALPHRTAARYEKAAAGEPSRP